MGFGARVPDTVVVPGHSTPWRAFADAYFARSPVAVWHASRGFGGKSYLLALLGLTEALTLQADVKILGGSGAQSRNVQDYISEELYSQQNAPRQLWKDEPLTTESRFVWGNSIAALMASSKSVRGPHPQRLRCDEVDEMTVALFDAALGQPMGKTVNGQYIPPHIVASSTHHYPDGTMTEIKRRARENGWPVYEWGWQETSAEGGWLSRHEVEQKRAVVPAHMWQVEYDLQEPVSEGRAILMDYVDKMFDKALGSYKGAVGEYIEIEGPVSGARYATGADWARKQDYTVIWTWRTDVYPHKLVAFERRQREAWPRMVQRYNKRLQRYRGKRLHDQTGVGDVVNDYLDGRGRGMVMVGARRKALFTNYIGAIEDGAFLCPDIEWARNEHKYADVDDLYGSGHPPDSVVAAALAYEASRHGGARGT